MIPMPNLKQHYAAKILASISGETRQICESAQRDGVVGITPAPDTWQSDHSTGKHSREIFDTEGNRYRVTVERI